jgi:periplasmic divalent cation tolerance protein
VIIVFTTTPKAKEAESLAEKIVAEKLAACVQVLPAMKSFYFWESAVRKDTEHLLLIKTLDEKFDNLKAFIHSNHSYDVPEIIAVKAENVSESYLGWLTEYLKSEN